MDEYLDVAREALAAYPDWEVYDEVTLGCPCGDTIEWDGRCPQGCVSPLRTLGLI